MLPSSKRLTIPLFKEVIDKGRSLHSDFFIIRLLKSSGQSRFSVSVPKKVAKGAIERNKIRRRAYSVIAAIYSKAKSGIHGVLVAKSPVSKADFQDILSDIESFFVKTGLLK